MLTGTTRDTVQRASVPTPQERMGSQVLAVPVRHMEYHMERGCLEDRVRRDLVDTKPPKASRPRVTRTCRVTSLDSLAVGSGGWRATMHHPYQHQCLTLIRLMPGGYEQGWGNQSQAF